MSRSSSIEKPSERARRDHLRLNIAGTAAGALATLALGKYWQDETVVGLAIGVLLTMGILLALSKSLRYKNFALWSLLSGAFLVALSQLWLPFGAAALAFYIPFGITIAGLSINYWQGFTIFALSLFLPALALATGQVEPHVSAIPAWQIILVSVCISGLALHWQMTAVRETLLKVLATLANADERLKQERAQLALGREQLMLAANEYSVEIASLTQQIIDESRLTSDLERRREEHQRLVHAIHHDLREPLRGIVSFTQLIQRKLRQTEDSESDRLAEYLAFAEDGGRRMARMLEDLVSYTSDTDGERASQVSLRTLIYEVEQNLDDLIRRSGAHITVESLPVVWGHRTQLLQLFQNLISNALKFSKPGIPPQLHITLDYPPDGGVVVHVRDNGVGIPPNQIEKVFGLFNRAHSADGYEGTGVGLALCRKIVIAHGGDIRVSSVPAEGSTFLISLPEEMLIRYCPVTVDRQIPREDVLAELPTINATTSL